MQEQAWDALLRRVPAAYHDGLVVSTSSGAEIVLQSILRADETFLIVRGRAAGSSDNGKVIIIPYQQITYITFSRRLTEPEVQGIFGEHSPVFAAVPEILPQSDTEQTPSPVEENIPAPAHSGSLSSPATRQPGTPAADSTKVSKSMLLAKLRARLASESSKGPKR